jgi:OOP family OmpA-OmpF porin
MREPNPSGDDFNKLRTILLKPTAQMLNQLGQRVDSIEESVKTLPTAESVGAVLPEAVRISARTNENLATVLAPVMESAMDQSIARNKDRMVAALYPIVGAMIRKSVVEGIWDAVASINKVLERSLSLEGLKWRWESFRTGVPVSVIAFRRSVIFRTEHIFLIHNKTARLLYHLSSPEAAEADPLVFAGMVGAITDFVKDAFYRDEPIGLRAIDLGEFRVRFEEGPDATLAAVIRGEPQPILRLRLKAMSEELHAQYPHELHYAMVDDISRLGYDAVLRDSLIQQPREHVRKRSGRIAAIVVGTALLILGAIGVSNFLRTHFRDARFERFISDVRSSKNILITDYGKGKDGKYFVAGVVAGSTVSPALPIEQFGFKPDEVEVNLINHVFAVDRSNNAQIQGFLDQLHELDGTPCPIDGSDAAAAWLETTANRIGNAYVLGRALGRPFIVVIEYPDNLKAKADELSGRISWRLYLQGIYEPHLVRTLAVPRKPAVLRVLQESVVEQ